MGGTEHLERRSSRSLIFLVLRSREAFKLRFSCLTSLKPLFSPFRTDFRLVDCCTLNWSKSTRTPALHSVQMKVSEQHSSVEWSDESDVMAAAAAERPSTEVSIQLLCIRGTGCCGVALYPGMTIHSGGRTRD